MNIDYLVIFFFLLLLGFVCCFEFGSICLYLLAEKKINIAGSEYTSSRFKVQRYQGNSISAILDF